MTLLNGLNSVLIHQQDIDFKVLLSLLTIINSFDLEDLELLQNISETIMHIEEKNHGIVQFIYFYINIDLVLGRYLNSFESLKELELVRGKEIT